MARKLPATDVVIVGLGWTGSILAHELAATGLNVVAIERGPWRDTATDFPPAYAQDELRYHIRHDLFLRPAQVTMTFRHNVRETALNPQLGVLHAAEWGWRRRRALECGDLALSAQRLPAENTPDPALRRKILARRHDDPGLGRHL